MLLLIKNRKEIREVTGNSSATHSSIFLVFCLWPSWGNGVGEDATECAVLQCPCRAAGAEGLVLRSEGVRVADATMKAKKVGIA